MLLSLFLACTPEEMGEDLVALASAQGPHAVGHLSSEVATTRIATGEERLLPLQVWYPAEAASTGAAVYTVAGLASVPSPHASARPTLLPGRHPVAVYSHGSGGVGALGYPYAERLASHGWIVVAPDHLGNTTLDLLGGGASFATSAIDRPLDIIAVLDQLDAGLEGLDADTSAVLLFGHSFGGYTAFANGGATLDLDTLGPLCPPGSDDPDCIFLTDPAVVQAVVSDAFTDPRIATIVPQAPAVFGFGPTSIADLDLPVLIMSSGRDITTPNSSNARVAWDALDGPDDRWLRIPEGGHHTFITTCDDVGVDLMASFLTNVRQDGCGEDNLPIAEAVPVMATVLLAWGNWHILGEPDWATVLDADLHPGINTIAK